MADIQIKCSTCGSVVTLSEHADPAIIKCKSCGHPLGTSAPPGTQPPPPESRPKRKLRAVSAPSSQTTPENAGETEEQTKSQWQFVGEQKPAQPETSGLALSHIFASWGLFAVVAAISAAAKYVMYFPEITTYGPYLLLAFQVAILMKAFKDSMFQGTLCLLVPFYSFYYLFFICDDFYLRAIIGGLTVGIAEDSYWFYKDIVVHTYNSVTDWIRSGGG